MHPKDAVIIDENAVVIQVNEFIKHDGYTHHLPGAIRRLYEISSTTGNKKIVFQFADGEPIKIVAFDQIVADIAELSGWDHDQIVFDLVDHVPRAHTRFQLNLRHSQFFYLAQQMVKADQCLLDSDPILFGAFFGRFTLHRMLMAHFLETQLPHHSMVAFQPPLAFAESECAPLQQYFQPQLEWLKNRVDKNITLDHTFNGCVSARDCLPVYHEIFGRYAIEVIIETNVHDMGWFTEKTTKCLAAGKPFVLFGTQGQLQALRNMGFRTFDGIINEQYDLESNMEKRFDLVCAEIQRLAQMSQDQQAVMVKQLYQIADYNKNHYGEIVKRYYQTPL